MDARVLMEENNVDAILVFSESYNSPNMYYLTSLLVPDPFLYILPYDDKPIAVVPDIEVNEAREKCKEGLKIYSIKEFIEEFGYTEKEKYLKITKKLIQNFDLRNIGVPRDFPIFFADKLKNEFMSLDQDIEITSLDLSRVREIKGSKEIKLIEKAQRCAEKGMARARDILKDSSVIENKLYYNDNLLTSEKLRIEIEIELIKNGCTSFDIIASSGRESSNPHNSGKGPMNSAPIMIDIFPQLKLGRYCGDLTRTFSKNEDSEILKRYEFVSEAQEIAFDLIKDGVKGSKVHNIVCEYFEELGFGTPRSNSKSNANFIHSTGHGIGLEIHETPKLGPGGREMKKGHVVTVEPGLYDPKVGGIRIEDVVVVNENGFKNLTEFEKKVLI